MLFPWTTINLVDFFFVRKGRYVVGDIFDPNGRYGRFNYRALIAYGATILVEIPFMSTAFLPESSSKQSEESTTPGSSPSPCRESSISCSCGKLVGSAMNLSRTRNWKPPTDQKQQRRRP